jgi:hypothetical protein
MNNVAKYTLITIGLNILSVLVLTIPLMFLNNEVSFGLLMVALFAIPVSLILQIVFGISYAVGKTKKDLGKGMLLGVGIILLIGLSVCGSMWMSF